MSQAFNNILVVQDAYRETVAALEWAGQLIAPTGRIKVLDIQPPLSAFWQEILNDGFERPPSFQRKQCLSKLVKGVTLPAAEVTAQVRKGTPVVEIVRETLEGRFDLVVKESYAKASDYIFGSLDMRLMRFCPTPVWMVNPKSGGKCHRVLVALNPEASEKEMRLNKRLLDYGVRVATGFDCKLFIVAAYHSHVTAFPVLDRESLARVEIHSIKAKQQAREKLDTLIAGSTKPIDSKNVIFKDGLPDEVIVNAVNEIDPDLLVMGSVARHGISGLMIGNAAERVLRQVQCSVLTVKPLDFVCPIGPEKSAGEEIPISILAF